MSIDRYNFWQVFSDNSDGSLTTKLKISVNGVTLNEGVVLRSGTAFGGVDFHDYKNLDLAGEYVGEVLDIKGFFRR